MGGFAHLASATPLRKLTISKQSRVQRFVSSQWLALLISRQWKHFCPGWGSNSRPSDGSCNLWLWDWRATYCATEAGGALSELWTSFLTHIPDRILVLRKKRCWPARLKWSCGVMVSTLDSESSDPSSNLGGTYQIFLGNDKFYYS